MNSIKTRLVVALSIGLLTTLAMAGVLSFGASSLDFNAQRTRAANDEVRELLSFALVAHRYMNAFGQSLGQRTLVANNERRVTAQAFEDRVKAIPAQQTSGHAIPWDSLREISNDLHRDLKEADVLRAAGKFYEAERSFNRARRTHFDQRMLPWFESAIEAQRTEVETLETRALSEARTLRGSGNMLATLSAVLAFVATITTLRAVIRPVRLLVEGAAAMARRDFAHRIAYGGPDELGVLAARFNEMAEVVETSQRTLVEKNSALEDAYRLQGEFLSIVSHELRSPLHSILGLTELVLEDGEALPEIGRKNVGNIATGAKRLLALINDILDFSKLKAGRMQLREERFPVSDLARAVVEDGRALAQGRAIAVTLAADEERLGEMLSDETKVRQILTNLVSNAIKFTDRGAVTLHVERAEPESDSITFRVVDTGIGIPSEQLGIIFEPFRQAKGSDRRAVSGTGLGLAIVSRLSEGLGGHVSVQSTVGQGTEFTVTLPARIAPENGQYPDHR